MRRKLFQNETGFTMVELVMVIVIVGMMAAIIVPKFTAQKDQAGIAATKANLENLRTAVAMYYANEGQWPSDDCAELVTGGAITGTIYLRDIPSTMTYDPAQAQGPVPPNNLVDNRTAAEASTPNAGGWYWDYANNDYTLHPNLEGQDANIMLFTDY